MADHSTRVVPIEGEVSDGEVSEGRGVGPRPTDDPDAECPRRADLFWKFVAVQMLPATVVGVLLFSACLATFAAVFIAVGAWPTPLQS